MYYNSNKHLHKNTIKAGLYYPYKHYKHSSKKHSKNKPKGKYLNSFWEKFNPLTSEEEKIGLLRWMSYKKFHHRFNYPNMRKRTYKMTSIPCKVCGKSPTITHHIVLLKNGGLNKKKNLIRLCELCHAQIHDWMLKEAIEKEEKRIFADYYNMFGI